MKTLKNANFELQISEAPSERFTQSHPYKVHALGKEKSMLMSGIKIHLLKPESSTCEVYSNGFPTSQSAENALLLRNTLFLAVGPYICALGLPKLDLAWALKADPSLFFGIYYAARHNVLIAHGEQTIACLFLDGTLKWSYSGRDIFTTPDTATGKTTITLLPDAVEVLDWNKERYRISILDGIGSIIGV